MQLKDVLHCQPSVGLGIIGQICQTSSQEEIFFLYPNIEIMEYLVHQHFFLFVEFKSLIGASFLNTGAKTGPFTYGNKQCSQPVPLIHLGSESHVKPGASSPC